MTPSEAATVQPTQASDVMQAASNFWTGRRVCVTGGHGFLGRHVVSLLRLKGADVCLVSRRMGYDLRSLEQAQSYLDTQRPELVINCASNQGGIGYQQLFPGTIYYDNLLMGANTMAQLDDNLGAAKLSLSTEEMSGLDALTAPPMLYPNWFTARVQDPVVTEALKQS